MNNRKETLENISTMTAYLYIKIQNINASTIMPKYSSALRISTKHRIQFVPQR